MLRLELRSAFGPVVVNDAAGATLFFAAGNRSESAAAIVRLLMPGVTLGRDAHVDMSMRGEVGKMKRVLLVPLAFTLIAGSGACGTVVSSGVPSPADGGRDAMTDASAVGLDGSGSTDVTIDVFAEAGALDSGPDGSLVEAGGSDAATNPEAAVEGGTSSCNSESDCSAATGTSVACNVDTHGCVHLLTTECPYALGEAAAEDAGLAPLYIGAFATLPPANPTGHPSYLNYELAQSDFAGQGGIPAGTGSALRVPVFVVCSDTADVNVVLNHLVNEVGVRALIAPLPSASLQQAFANVNLSGDAAAPSVFFMNPFGTNSSLSSLITNGLLWHMLGQPSDLAPAYAAFLPRVEAYVRSTTSLGPTSPMRLATVTSNSVDTTDLASAATAVLTWNGGHSSVATEGSDCTGATNYCAVSLSHSTLDGDALADIDVTDAVNQLATFRPDVVISFAADEFATLILTLETTTTTNPTPPKPFYLLGPYNAGSSYVLQWLPASVEPSVPGGDAKRERIAGINFASSPNNQVLADYETHFVATFGSASSSDLGAENYYDSAYFTVYSIVAAHRPPTLEGSLVGAGMAELVNEFSSSTYSVGPDAIGNVVAALQAPGTPEISLVGTLGPPDFNMATGARISTGDVWCVARDPMEAGAPAGGVNDNPPYYSYDVLRLVADGGSLDGGLLQGAFPCYPGM